MAYHWENWLFLSTKVCSNLWLSTVPCCATHEITFSPNKWQFTMSKLKVEEVEIVTLFSDWMADQWENWLFLSTKVRSNLWHSTVRRTGFHASNTAWQKRLDNDWLTQSGQMEDRSGLLQLFLSGEEKRKYWGSPRRLLIVVFRPLATRIV